MVRCFRVRTSSASRLGRRRSHLLRQEVELQGQRVGGLRPLADAPGLGHELPPERRLDLRELVRVARGVVCLAEHERRAPEQVGRVREEGGGDEVLARGRTRDSRWRPCPAEAKASQSPKWKSPSQMKSSPARVFW